MSAVKNKKTRVSSIHPYKLIYACTEDARENSSNFKSIFINYILTFPDKKAHIIMNDKRLFFKLNKAQRLLMNYFDQEAMAGFGVSITQIAALFYLHKNDGCNLKDLSIELSQNKSAITTLVERMVKNGLVHKTASEKDGRAFHIFLTEKGRNISEKALPMVRDNNMKLAALFTAEEIEIVNRFFDEIIKIYK